MPCNLSKQYAKLIKFCTTDNHYVDEVSVWRRATSLFSHFVLFSCSPTAPVETAKEPEWSDSESNVVHLTDSTFTEHISAVPSVLVMFYAPCE